MKAFLIDIEGTTVPISFVHQTLFPFARERITEFLNSYEFEVADFTEIKQEFDKDITSGVKEFIELFPNHVSFSKKDIAPYLCYLIDVDRKFGILKKIQGKIWKEGYEKGLLKSHLFDDVPEFLKKADENQINCFVYSSGSVEAQLLIYKYSNFGDLTSSFSAYFDTAMGGKKDVQSYLNIAHHLALDPKEFTFFTDILEEADAAKNAGMTSILLDRPGNAKQAPHNYRVLSDLLSFF